LIPNTKNTLLHSSDGHMNQTTERHCIEICRQIIRSKARRHRPQNLPSEQPGSLHLRAATLAGWNRSGVGIATIYCE